VSRPPFFGLSLEGIPTTEDLAQAQRAGIGSIRLLAIPWDRVEPVRTDPPTYRWEVLVDLEKALMAAAQAGVAPTLVVQFTPEWAQAVAGHSCGPIRADRLDAFAQFLTAAVDRYSRPPYGIRSWELFNEPDVDPAAVPADSVFGCWGETEDAFFGGGRYAQMLRRAYPAIKQADPGAQVILGGLLLDAPNGAPATFLPGVLEEGGGEFFDMLAFHGYAYYNPNLTNWDTPPNSPWTARGGVVAGKASWLRETLQRYGQDKPLLLNEAGLIWYSADEPPEEYRLAQADYIIQLYTRGLALNLRSVSWYGWAAPAWQHMELFDPDRSPTPAYHTLVTAIEQLGGAEFLGPTSYPGTEGYGFRRGQEILQVVWSDSAAERQISLPPGRLVQALDLSGQPIPPRDGADGQAILVRRPTYLRLTP